MRNTNRFTRFLPVCGRCVLLGLLIGLLGTVPSPATAQTVEWIRQSGASIDDCSYGVSADGLGNVYISGSWGNPSNGDPRYDDYPNAFVSKYDASGTLQWNKQLRMDNPFTPGPDDEARSYGVSADGLGNVYISGSSAGPLGEGLPAGGEDTFVSKFDAAGTLLWTKQWGTSSNDVNSGVSADGLGNVYVTGSNSGQEISFDTGVFIIKYDDSGSLLWDKIHFPFGFNISDIFSSGVSADGLGNVYISGNSYYWNEVEAFLSKFDDSGTLLWAEQLGTSGGTLSKSVSSDGLGNVYVTGIAFGSLEDPNTGEGDAFLSKYDASGTLLWTEELGTSSTDESLSVSADGLGKVYISGATGGNLGGSNAGGHDAFVSKYDASGMLLWTEQLGSGSDDVSYGVSADGLGNVYFSGDTEGNLGGPNAGGGDAFVGKIVPEPGTLVGLLGLCLAGLLGWGRRRRLRER